jgi:dUTP pyrophosphatase
MMLKIKRLDKTVNLPKYALSGDAAFDLLASKDITLKPMERAMIPTGIAMEIPEGHVGLIWDKSGLSMKFGLKTLGGVIDAGYRGEIMIGMINLGSEDYMFLKNQKVAQMIIQKKETAIIEEVEDLSDSSRGTGGFGSTGK